jgi:DNA-nicking Smr family endonuclease
MSPSSRPMTPVGQQKSPIVCRYWLQSGHCARADCRFSHSLENHVCKFWLSGNCLAGNMCQFSHDPMAMMQQLSLTNSNSDAGTPQQLPPNLQLQDYDSFPSLQPQTSNPYEDTDPLVDPTTISSVLLQNQQQAFAAAPPGLFPNFVPTGPRNASRPGSRPGSRHTSRAPTPGSQPNFNDDEAFPSLGSAAANRPGKRHHGKRGGHGHHNNVSVAPQPGSLADVVRMSPSPAPSGPKTREAMRRGLQNNRSFTSTRENGTAALSIAAPKDVPWLETGENVNRVYLKARSDAMRHGGLRNKFLQSAAQAWNRNDARGAKALSLRGQNENALMREAHREAARSLYEERNKQFADGRQKELYVDLHGLHAEEAVSYLSECLLEHKLSSRPVYAITGTGHHSKNGKDKVGKAVRQYLTEWRYAFREFSVPGDRNNVGGILGVDPSSYDKELAKKGGPAMLGGGDGDSGIDLTEGRREDSKVLLARDDPRKMVRVDAEDEVLERGSF